MYNSTYRRTDRLSISVSQIIILHLQPPSSGVININKIANRTAAGWRPYDCWIAVDRWAPPRVHDPLVIGRDCCFVSLLISGFGFLERRFIFRHVCFRVLQTSESLKVLLRNIVLPITGFWSPELDKEPGST